MNELQWTKKICDGLKASGWDVTALVASKRQRPGLPDRMLIGFGSVVFLEFKGPKTKVRLNQKILLANWYKQGIHAYVCRMRSGLYSGLYHIEDSIERREVLVSEFTDLNECLRRICDVNFSKNQSDD